LKFGIQKKFYGRKKSHPGNLAHNKVPPILPSTPPQMRQADHKNKMIRRFSELTPKIKLIIERIRERKMNIEPIPIFIFK